MGKMMDSINDELIPYINKAEFPFFVIPKIRQLGTSGMWFKDHGGSGLNDLEAGVVFFEMAKRDGSISLFYLIQNALGMNLVNNLGNEEQRNRFLPEAVSLNKFMSFCLTEPQSGSDASGLKCYVTKTEGGFILNGQKRWIGNGTFADYLLVWARNENEHGKI